MLCRFRRPAQYKCARLETLPSSEEVAMLLGMVGEGQAHVAAAHAVARANLANHGASAMQATQALASAGAPGGAAGGHRAEQKTAKKIN